MAYIFFWSAILFGNALLAGSKVIVPKGPDSLKDLYFRIKVDDEQTGRGVPLVSLTTTNHLSYTTDSNGIAAIYEPGLMNQRVFFYVSSHGYEYPKDGFGFRGKVVEVEPGGTATISIRRINIAERWYRVTGQGLYRDSVITGDPVPIANPIINGLVMGQDSVYTCKYKGRLYWFWGDTSRPSYPLGHFAVAGATSNLPGRGGLDPSVGVELHYFIDQAGFSQKMAPMSEPGMIWLDGILAVNDSTGRPRMIAKYARMKSLGEAYERGLMVFNDETHQFEPIIRGGPQFLPYHDSGHAISIKHGEEPYYYFATPFPLSVSMRVQALWEHVTDPNKYEVFTLLDASQTDTGISSVERRHQWISSRELLRHKGWGKGDLIDALRKEKENSAFIYDISTGKAVSPHGGTVYWNEYRRKWIMIAVQAGGDSSFLGEVWYAEADTPLGPWGYGQKIVTHNNYSFYNPQQHPYFDQEKGRLIYFEGTYSYVFSGRQEDATPRYDYNQIMYRLDLSDQRLYLPVPVYEVQSTQGHTQLLLGEEARRRKKGLTIKTIPFWAIPPDRGYEGLIHLYVQEAASGGFVLSKTPPSESAEPLFYGRSGGDSGDAQDSFVVPLFEYSNRKTGDKVYSIEDMQKDNWLKTDSPLCYVWKNPAEVMLADWEAEPGRESGGD